MTNPFKQFEHEMYDRGDLLQRDEQIVAADPSAIKSLMEVYRDTANQLNAQTMRLEQERSERRDVERDLQISNDLQSELKTKIQELESAKKFAENASTLLGDELADYKKRFEKIYRHRDELADRVQKARKVLYELKDWLSEDVATDEPTNPYEVLESLEEQLEDALGAEPAQEEDDF